MLDLLEEPAYQHILLNHLPITGLLVTWIVLVAATIRGQSAWMILGLLLVALAAGASYPVGVSGDAAYPDVFDTLGDDSRAWLEYHTHLADTWLAVLYFNAGAALIAIGLGLWRASWLRPAAIAVAVLTVAGLGAASWIADAGGKIKHPEFRFSDPPKYETPRRIR